MNLKVNLAGVELKNPVMTASGTFGSGMEYSEFVDLSRLGAVVTKGVANHPWPGNPTPRIAEVTGGMLNAIGLQNPGIDVFCERDIPFLKQYDTKIIVNVCGKTTEDYLEVVERLADEPVDLLEINISCPNVKEGGIAFGQDPKAVEAITKAVKEKAKQPVIMKLSPNVTDIVTMAKAAEAGGADVLSLINTLTGEAGRRAHGISGGACGERSRHRYGRHPECGGCHRVPDGRSNSRLCRNGEFPQSLHHRRGCGWHRGLYARSRHGRCKGDFPRRVRSLKRLEMM